MFFRYFFTHFKWSKPGLKQNCEASLSPINQDFLESYQYIAMADEKHFNHSFISPSFAPECPVLQGVMGGMVKCSEITDCGKTEQN